MIQDHPHIMHIVDGVAVIVVAASLANILPATAAIFTIVWTGVRIYEMVVGEPFASSRFAKWITGRA